MSFALAVAREEFQRLSAADLSQQDFQGVWAAHFYGTGVIRQVEMTPASREPVSWHAVTRDLNRYRVVSAMAMFRQLSYGVISHTTPSSPLITPDVVPYMFPLASKITAPSGPAPPLPPVNWWYGL